MIANPLISRAQAKYSALTDDECNLSHYHLLPKRHPISRLESSSYLLKLEPVDALKGFTASPNLTVLRPKRKAVVIDCEMAIVHPRRSEVISVYTVNFIREALVNCLVFLAGRVTDWKAEIHGITTTAMSVGKTRGRVLKGCKATQVALWKHVNNDTIPIGHLLQHDLRALRIIHTNVVDMAILTSEAAFGAFPAKLRCTLGLVRLCKDSVDLEIRTEKGGTHSALRGGPPYKCHHWWQF